MDTIDNKDKAIAFIKKIRKDYGWDKFRKLPPGYSHRISELIAKFGLSSKDIN